MSEADEVLRLTTTSSDQYEDYVTLVLKLHIAVALKRDADAQRILASLEPARRSQPGIRLAIEAIEQGDFETAVLHEVELLLVAA